MLSNMQSNMRSNMLYGIAGICVVMANSCDGDGDTCPMGENVLNDLKLCNTETVFPTWDTKCVAESGWKGDVSPCSAYYNAIGQFMDNHILCKPIVNGETGKTGWTCEPAEVGKFPNQIVRVSHNVKCDTATGKPSLSITAIQISPPAFVNPFVGLCIFICIMWFAFTDPMTFLVCCQLFSEPKYNSRNSDCRGRTFNWN